MLQVALIALLTPHALARPLLSPVADAYPVHRITFGDSVAIKPIKLVGGRGEHLLMIFAVFNLRDRHLSIFLRGNSGPSLELQAYMMPPLPNVSGQDNLFDVLVPLEQGAVLDQDVTYVVVRLKIPNSYPPGTQHIDLIFRSGGNDVCQPMDLRIWKLTLPEDLPVTVLGNLWPSKEWFGRYGVKGEEAFSKTIIAYLKFMRLYKINATGSFYPLPVLELAKGRSLNDFPVYLRLLDQVLGLGYRYFRLPTLPGAERLGSSENPFEQYAATYYAEMVKFLKSRNLVDKALVKVWDEPKPADYPQVAKAYALVKAVAPELTTESAGRIPDPSLARFVDIWAVYNVFFNHEKVKENLQAGQKIWFYANLLHGVDRPAICQRLVGWYLFKSGCSGYLFWSVNYWPHDPWTQPPGVKDFFRRGTLIYPHFATGQPLPTLRLEIMRRGWEDYQYLALLKEAFERGKVAPATYAKIQEQVTAVAGNLKNNNPQVSWQLLEDLRLQVGELLEQAAGVKHD